MSDQRTHYRTGHTIEEYLAEAPDELTVDAVGMWQIIGAGKGGFRLEGKELEDFVRRYIRGLLMHGARPVVGLSDGPPDWRIETRYGATAKAIDDAVVAEWLASDVDPDLTGLWFATPQWLRDEAPDETAGGPA